MAIRFRRGNYADFDKNKLLQGELAIILDKGELYFCYGAGDIRRLQTREDLIELLNTNPETYAALEGVLGELSEAPEEVLAILANFRDIEEIIKNAEIATERANDISDDLEQKIADDYFRGEKGDTGDRGVNWRGAYSPDTTYYQYDGVSFNGSSYICIVESTQGNDPTDSTKWDILANKGADGLGAGDMLKSVYDPQGKEQDIFEYADTKIPLEEKGEPGGVATLDEDGKVPDEQLPEIESPVTSVNGQTGDVVLAAEDVGAETPAGAQAKANVALAVANTYTDQEVGEVAQALNAHLNDNASTSKKGHVQLTDSVSSTSITTAATPNSVKQAYDKANAALPKTGGIMTGILTAQSNTSYTVRQVRNIILSTTDADVDVMQNGDIWIKYK